MYYILQNDKIILADDNRERIENAVRYSPKFFGLEIQETERPIVPSSDLSYFQFADTPEYEQEQAQKEVERLAMLNLTAADVERAIYKAKGIDFDDIVTTMESTQPSGIDVKALKIELKANNFFRGNPYIDAVGTLLGFTPEQLNRFFEAGNSDDTEIKADAYKYLTTVTFTIEPVPTTATVTINGETATTLAVPYGSTVEYTVTAEGYLSQSGSMEVVNNTSISVELVEEPTEEDNGAGEASQGSSNPPADEEAEDEETTE